MTLADRMEQLIKNRANEIKLAERKKESEATLSQVQTGEGAALLKRVNGFVYQLWIDDCCVTRCFDYLTKGGRWSLNGNDYYQNTFPNPFTEELFLSDLEECLKLCEAVIFKN